MREKENMRKRWTKQNINQHTMAIYDSGELDRNRTVKKYLTVQTGGARSRVGGRADNWSLILTRRSRGILAAKPQRVDEAKCVIISVRAEGGLMRKRETRKAMTRYAWEAVNVPAIRCLYTTWSVYGVWNTNLAAGGANDTWRTERADCKRRGQDGGGEGNDWIAPQRMWDTIKRRRCMTIEEILTDKD